MEDILNKQSLIKEITITTYLWLPWTVYLSSLRFATSLPEY